MGRATVDGLVFPPPNVNGMLTQGGAGYDGERHVRPYLTPVSWLGRIMCPVPRVDFRVSAGFYIHPVNRRAGGADT
jgi:hypothetical protein